jgi:hypothetical protein
MEQKIALKDTKLRTQIHGKCNDMGIADENKQITLKPLFKNHKKTIH